MHDFPVTESTLSAFHLREFLQKKYRLSPETICTLFRTGMNHLYMVRDGASTFVLRIYTFDWRTKTEVSEELRLLLHLQDQGISISYPIADISGNFIQELHAPEGTRFGVLFSFAEGKKIPRFTEQASHQVGIAMAKIHKATENFTLNRITYNSTTLLSDSLKIIKSFFINRSAEIEFIEQAAAFLTREFQKIDTSSVRFGAVHLDIWFDNLHFGNENKITIFDFDFCGNGWLCHDISYFLCQLNNTHPDKIEYKLKAEAFLKGYETITILTQEERRLVRIACLAVMIFYISMQCVKYDTWSNIFLNEDHLRRMVAILKNWIEYHHLEIGN